MTVVDFAVMIVYLRDTSQETPFSRKSQSQIAAQIGSTRYTVRRSVEHLHSLQWLKKSSGKRRYNTNLVEVLYANLPVYVPEILVITENAKAFAKWHRDVFWNHLRKYKNKKGRKCTRPLRKDWEQRWAPVFQRRINLEGFDGVRKQCEEFYRVAFQDPGNPKQRTMQKKFIAGPQSFPWSATVGQSAALAGVQSGVAPEQKEPENSANKEEEKQ